MDRSDNKQRQARREVRNRVVKTSVYQRQLHIVGLGDVVVRNGEVQAPAVLPRRSQREDVPVPRARNPRRDNQSILVAEPRTEDFRLPRDKRLLSRSNSLDAGASSCVLKRELFSHAVEQGIEKSRLVKRLEAAEFRLAGAKKETELTKNKLAAANQELQSADDRMKTLRLKAKNNWMWGLQSNATEYLRERDEAQAELQASRNKTRKRRRIRGTKLFLSAMIKSLTDKVHKCKKQNAAR